MLGVCMAIEFTCPACGGTLRIRDEAVGQLVRCGGCFTTLRVPEAEPASSPSPAPFPGEEPAFPPLQRQKSPDQAILPAPANPPQAEQVDQPEPAPQRTAMQAWLLIASGMFAVGACGCCGFAAALLSDPEWQQHESTQGGFKVELPAEPRDDMAKRLKIPGVRHVEGTFLWTRAENYVVIYWDEPLTNLRLLRQSDDQRLDEQTKAITSGPEVENVLRTEPIQVSGFPGREFEFRYSNGGTITGRVILVGPRVYVLWAGGRFTRPGNKNVSHFLESFTITEHKHAVETDKTERDNLKAAAASAAKAAFEVVEQQLEDKP
jgi:hypothetical protein